MSATPGKPAEDRFDRALPLPIIVACGALLIGFVLVLRLQANATRSGDFIGSLSVALWVLIPLVVLIALTFAYLGATAASELRAVRALEKTSLVFVSAATVELSNALPLFGVDRAILRYRFTVAADQTGLRFRRMGEAQPFVTVPWARVASIEPGTAAQHVGRPLRAIILNLAIAGDALKRLPLPVFDPRMPWMVPVSTANARLDDLRRLWGEAQRAARNQSAASGGSVSSADAGRPPQGSSDATTDP